MTAPRDAIIWDFETRSRCDLRTAGADRYSKDASTGVWCLSWAFKSEPDAIHTWTPGMPPPAALVDHIANGGTLTAFNAPFEHLIYTNVLRARDPDNWPELRVPQNDCLMARALAMGLPGNLDDCARVLRLGIEKDAEGRRLMLQLAKPRAKTDDWWQDNEKLARLISYCEQDVRAELAVDKVLPPLTTSERATWLLDFKINRKGIKIDTASVRRALAVVQEETAQACVELGDLTKGAVTTPTQVAKLVKWIGDEGVKAESVAKGDVAELLRRPSLPPKVRRVLEIRAETGLASVKKLKAMIASACPDDRARGLLRYHAAVTGRHSSVRLQIQNLARPNIDNDAIETAFSVLPHPEARRLLWLLYGPPIEALGSCIRGMLTATEGNKLIGCDFSNIEGRVLAWLAGQEDAVQAFRDFDNDEGPDIYKRTYAEAFNVPLASVSKDDRTIGKVMALACGYQGALGAFASMAEVYGLKIGDDGGDLTENQVVNIVHLWRAANPEIVKFWRRLEMAAMSAVRKPGEVFKAGKHIAYRCMKVGGRPYLFCRLPSKRMIAYYQPCVDLETGQIKYFGVNSRTRKPDWLTLYGGLLAENVTSGTARDLLMEALMRMNAAGHQVVTHVHDELVVDVPPEVSPREIETLMAERLSWCRDLPVACEAWAAHRYRK